MRAARIILGVISILAACGQAQQLPSASPSPSKRIVIAASMALDGKGHMIRDARIVIEGAKIVAIDSDSKIIDSKAGD